MDRAAILLACGLLLAGCGSSPRSSSSSGADASTDGPAADAHGDHDAGTVPEAGGEAGTLDGGILSVSVGENFSCALRSSGHVYCWGADNDGQTGYGSYRTSLDPSPHEVVNLDSVIQIVSGAAFTCALRSDGSVSCWGSTPNGAPGSAPAASPLAVTGLGDVTEITAGDAHACARKKDSSVWCWGDNSYGQLGHDNTSDPDCGTVNPTKCDPTPTQVAGVTAEQLISGRYWTCARQGTSVKCWGNGAPDQVNGTVVFGGGEAACGVTSAHVVKCWGSVPYVGLGSNSSIPGLPPSDFVSLGLGSACAIANGTVYCFGANNFAQEGTTLPDAGTQSLPPATPTGLEKDIWRVASGQEGQHHCAVSVTGKVWCWGWNYADQLGHDYTTDPLCQGIAACNPTPTVVGGLP